MNSSETRVPRGGPEWLPIVALAAISCIWGVTWVVAKVALTYAPPFAIAAERCVGGAIALVAILKLSGRKLTFVAPWQLLGIALTQVTGFMAFQTWSLVESGAGKAAVLIFTMPLWTLLLARLVLGERIRGMQWVAAASTLSGLLLIISPWSLHTSPLGKALGIAAAVCWATSTVLVKRFRIHHSMDPLVLTTWQMLIGTVPLVLLALVVPERATQWNVAYIGALAFMAVLSTAAGWWLWSYILERVPAWEASLSVVGTPVVAIVSSTLLLGEKFKPAEVIGMVLIGAGLAILSLVGWLASNRRNGGVDEGRGSGPA